MEALTAVSVAALTIYDMCKALEKGITITDVRLESKTGGKSGDYESRSNCKVQQEQARQDPAPAALRDLPPGSGTSCRPLCVNPRGTKIVPNFRRSTGELK